MKREAKLIGGVVALLFLFGTAHATTWYVHPDSTLNSIQVGIDSCITGDIVLVGPGTYVENINFNGKAITVTSELGPDTTIIDGSNPAHLDTGSVVLFINSEDINSVLHGFKITNGSGTYVPGWGHTGGGIYCDNSSPTIMGNIITGDTADYAAGIECFNNSSPTITDNTISGNTADSSSGGIECYMYCSPYIDSNTIENNTSNHSGAGIQIYDHCSPDIINNTIINNTAGTWGGGIRVGLNSSPTIRGNHIEGNKALDGGGILCDGGINSSPLIVHNTIINNTANNYGGGIECDFNATPTIDSCTISNNTVDGIYCYTGGNPIIHYSDIVDNDGYAVFNADPSVTINAKNNWWGDATGPYHPTANPGGLGDTVSDYVDFDPWLVGIEEHKPIQPVATALQISPNPFRSRVTINFSTEHSAKDTELKIYDATGRLVKDFRPTPNALRSTQISWDGTDQANRQLPSGVYFLKLQTENWSATEKLLLIK